MSDKLFAGLELHTGTTEMMSFDFRNSPTAEREKLEATRTLSAEIKLFVFPISALFTVF